MHAGRSQLARWHWVIGSKCEAAMLKHDGDSKVGNDGMHLHMQIVQHIQPPAARVDLAAEKSHGSAGAERLDRNILGLDALEMTEAMAVAHSSLVRCVGVIAYYMSGSQHVNILSQAAAIKNVWHLESGSCHQACMVWRRMIHPVMNTMCICAQRKTSWSRMRC